MRPLIGTASLFGLMVLAALGSPMAALAEDALRAPTHLFHEPRSYLLLPLRGDKVLVRYVPGSLDRAANVQTRLERAMRSFNDWTDSKIEINVYALTRQEWDESQYALSYGLPIRVGRRSIVTPAEGDEGTVKLWSDLLEGLLPRVGGAPLRGTPQQAATMALADFLMQLQTAEIVIDEAGLAGDQHWVRGLVTHVAAVDFARRHDPLRVSDLDSMYSLLGRRHAPGTMSVRDYDADLGLRDWYWFQAQFYVGAQTILDKTGKGALKKLRKLAKKDDGVLRGDRLLKEFKELNGWFHQSFTTVSLRTGR